MGEQVGFSVNTIRFIPEALLKHRVEVLRLIAQMSFGVAELALLGGTVVIIGFITSNVGSIVGTMSYTQLGSIGIEALTGFLSAYINPRLVAGLITSVGLVITIGAGATAQLGAMRINEEIDALDVMGIRTVTYLASTRVLAGAIITGPLFCAALLAAIIVNELTVRLSFDQSRGVYNHYFNSFLNPTDIIWAFVQVMISGVIIMLIHTYYGFTAGGGPAGVGRATGRAVRASLIVATTVAMMAGLMLYGRSGDFNFAG
ncbi:ABC transporter permease [Mycobacterium sp. 1274756.6]|uniref:ABC transporter permease n=1 Tax=Mycobacterium sp. 1274756.6 TaxID=1834076 RepID=UPI001E59BD8F|nr:ABC transporter permease [Mycobacterium sp. 1274756.6]